MSSSNPNSTKVLDDEITSSDCESESEQLTAEGDSIRNDSNTAAISNSNKTHFKIVRKSIVAPSEPNEESLTSSVSKGLSESVGKKEGKKRFLGRLFESKTNKEDAQVSETKKGVQAADKGNTPNVNKTPPSELERIPKTPLQSEHRASIDSFRSIDSKFATSAAEFMGHCINHNWAEAELLLPQIVETRILHKVQDQESGTTPLMLACQAEKINIITKILDQGVDIDARDKMGLCALHYAIRNNNKQIVDILMENGANPLIHSTKNKRCPIHIVCASEEKSSRLLHRLVQYRGSRTVQDQNGRIPLLYAIENNITQAIKLLLKEEVEEQLNKVDNEGNSPLHIACLKNNLSIVKYLIERGASPDSKNKSNQTPLHIASSIGSEEITKYLFECNADPGALDSNDRSPLQIAIEKGHTKIQNLYINIFRNNLGERDKQGRTLIHMAASYGQSKDVILNYIQKGVSLHMPNKWGATCLHSACEMGNYKVVKTLIVKGAKVNQKNKNGYAPLHVACLNLHDNIVELLLGYGAKVSELAGKTQETPLHIAASQADGYNCVINLLKSGAEVNAVTNEGNTPLHLASRVGNVNVMKELLRENSQVFVTNNLGNTALHDAVKQCHYPVVSLLLNHAEVTLGKAGAVNLVTTQNNAGETAVHCAAALQKKLYHYSSESVDIMNLLLNFEGNLLAKTIDNEETPIHYCTKEGDSEILSEIIHYLGRKMRKIHDIVNAQAKNGWSPLHFASERNHVGFVQILVRNYCRIDIIDENGMTPTHIAAQKGNCEVMEVLLDHNAFVNTRTKAGLTPLHLAAANGRGEMVKLLRLKYNATLNACSIDNQTPLHMAALNGKKNVILELLNDPSSSLNPNALDNKQQTALHLAAQKGHDGVVKIFFKQRPETSSSIYDANGFTCSHIAAMNGCIGVFNELLHFNNAAVVNLKTKNTGCTNLHLAAAGGHIKIVETLLEIGARTNEENSEGKTPMHMAAQNGHTNVIILLRRYNVSPTYHSEFTGMTPMHVAAHYGQIEVVRKLVSMSVNPNVNSMMPGYNMLFNPNEMHLNDAGVTPLHLAACMGHEEMVRFLLACKDVEIDAKTHMQGLIPLHLAAYNGHENIVSLFLSKSPELVSLKDSQDRTPLHLAAQEGHATLAALLVGHGADINAVTHTKYTPLHLAAKEGHYDIIKWLIESGANMNIMTNDKKLPILLAAQFKNQQALSLFLKFGGDRKNLMSNNKFLCDLMLCSKLSDNQTLEDFILLSNVPIEIAANLSRQFDLLSMKEKEHSQDLHDASKYCSKMCLTLTSMAISESSAETILQAINKNDQDFLNILIFTEQKDVIAHPAVQTFMSQMWHGDYDISKPLMAIVVMIVAFPPLWILLWIPILRKYKNLPKIKYFLYFSSHLWFILFLLFTGVFPKIEIHKRSDVLPDPFEWFLVYWWAGNLISDYANPHPHRAMANLRIAILVLTGLAIGIHFCVVIVTIFDPSLLTFENNWLSYTLYIRNLICSFAIILSCSIFLDFLSIHHLFGPWSVIIRNLMSDLGRFLVIMMIVLMAFSVLLVANFQIIDESNAEKDREQRNAFSNLIFVMITLYFSIFAMFDLDDLPVSKNGDEYAVHSLIIHAMFLAVSIIVLINLLIAMMTDTYQKIKACSDIEWKYGRANFIRHIAQTSPIPSPLILVSYLLEILAEYVEKSKISQKRDDAFSRLIKKSLTRNFLLPWHKAKDKEKVLLTEVVNWKFIVERYNRKKLDNPEL